MIQLFASDHDVPLDSPCDLLGFGAVFWKFVVQEVVEIRGVQLEADREDLCFYGFGS